MNLTIMGSMPQNQHGDHRHCNLIEYRKDDVIVKPGRGETVRKKEITK